MLSSLIGSIAEVDKPHEHPEGIDTNVYHDHQHLQLYNHGGENISTSSNIDVHVHSLLYSLWLAHKFKDRLQCMQWQSLVEVQ